ncbi:MAG TPA: DMT family transporter [Burkholderiaceae bacterium]|nr:DMT family transporter [Burkholderiaceae bacterium]
MTANARPIPRWAGIALLLAISVMFASNHISARLAFDHGVNVPTAVAVRSAVTALFVLMLMRAAGVPIALPAAVRPRAVAIGLVLAVQSYCLYSAVARIPVALALLAFNTFPLLLALTSWVLGGERPSRRAWIAMPVALFGLALALDVAGRVGGTGEAGGFARRWEEIGAGVGYALAASLSFALAMYLTVRWLPQVDGRLRTAVTMAVVAVVTAAAAAPTAGFAFPADRVGWIGLALLTLFYGSAITSLFVVLPRLGAVNNAAVLNFEPIASLFLGWVILDQMVAPVQIVGAFIVIGAIVGLSIGRR